MNKFRNQPVRVDGIRFQSKAEARRYKELKLLQAAKTISGLKLQPRYPLIVDGVKICTYVADFEFKVKGISKLTIVEDVKGKEIQPFPIKAKLFKVLYKKTHRLFLVKNGKCVPY